MEGYIMNKKHQYFLDELTLGYHRHAERLIELGLNCDNISEAEIVEFLEGFSKDLTAMRTSIKKHLRSK